MAPVAWSPRTYILSALQRISNALQVSLPQRLNRHPGVKLSGAGSVLEADCRRRSGPVDSEDRLGSGDLDFPRRHLLLECLERNTNRATLSSESLFDELNLSPDAHDAPTAPDAGQAERAAVS